MKVRTAYYDVIFILTLEIILFFLYRFGPTPNYFPFALDDALGNYFLNNLSQFYAIMFIPYLPELLFHLYDLQIGMFAGLSIIWIPSISVLIWLIRRLFQNIFALEKMKFYYAYIPILFILFIPHTLLGIFTFNGSHFFSTLSQMFLMFITVLSGILFYMSGEKKIFAISAAAILLVNIQTFSMSFLIVSLFLLIFSVFTVNKGKAALRSVLLIALSISASFVYLYAWHATNLFPYYNLPIPNIGPTDPNGRVFLLSIFSPSRGLFNVFTMQNYVNDPYYPPFFPGNIYNGILFIITLISLIPFAFFSEKLRKIGIPIYLTFIAFELMNSFANPFISLVFPQNINLFYDLSYIFNNNTVFYNPMQILASLSFLFSLLSVREFIIFLKSHSITPFKKHLRRVRLKAISRYWKPALAIFFAVVMLSPLISYDAHQGLPSAVPYKEYSPFITYLNTQKNASIYFDTSSGNQLLSTIQSNLIPIENPMLTPDQQYPLSNAMSSFNEVYGNKQPGYMDYILHLFGFNFIATSNLTLSKELNNSEFFTLALNDSGVQLFKVSKEINQSKMVLLSSSVDALIKIVNEYGGFPRWIYSKYLLNLQSLESLFANNKPVYVTNYTTPQDLFPFISGIDYIIPAQYTANSYYSDAWKIGYLMQYYSQETWGQNIQLLNNYSYQSELNVNYGFIYTSTPNITMTIHTELPKGKYVVLGNYLKSNVGGIFSINISGNVNLIRTLNSSSFFVTTHVENYTSNGNGVKITVTNLNGFNTLAYLSFVPYSVYLKYLPLFEKYIHLSSE